MSSGPRIFAIASLLNPSADKATHELWQWLEWDCGLKGIRLTPTPHFSWQGALAYDHMRVSETLDRFVKDVTPFRVRAAGLGLFTGAAPVLYLPLVKNRQLVDLHERLWNLLTPFAVNPNEYYSPDNWMPHITLANRDVTTDNMCCAISGLLYQPLQLEVVVDHLVLIFAADDQVGMVARYDFEG